MFLLYVSCNKLVNQTYFFISNEKEKSIEFCVITESKTKVTAFFKEMIGYELGVYPNFNILAYTSLLSHLQVRHVECHQKNDVW